MPIRRFTLALVVLGFAATGSTLSAQVCGTVVPGEQQGLSARTSAAGAAARTMSAADRREIEGTLALAEQIVLRTVYGRPHGYLAVPHIVYDPPPSRSRLSSSYFAYVMYCPTRAAVGGDGTSGVEITLNPYPQAWSEGDRPMLDERGDRIYTERIRKPAQFGSTLTFSQFDDRGDLGLTVLFTAGGESPTLPVTREEFLRAVIVTIERGASAKSAYQEWMEQAPARKQARDEMAATIEDTAQWGKTRRDLERQERETTESLRNAAQSANPLTERLRTRLDALTPAERTLPAFVSGDEFVPPTSPYAHAIVRENPAFYRARRSPVEPRAILIKLPQRTYQELERERQQMFRELDWAALKRLVAQPD